MIEHVGGVGTVDASVWDVVRLFAQATAVWWVGAAVVWVVRRTAHWWYTGPFIDRPRQLERVVADRPFDPDRVLHTVGRWEYLKERVGLGIGPRGLCGRRLYSDAGEAVSEPDFEDAPWCPDCVVCWEGLSPWAK